MERSSEVRVRKHHVADIAEQVSEGRPDALPACIPKGIRYANVYLVEALINGAEMVVVEDEPDAICFGCPLLPTCDLKD